MRFVILMCVLVASSTGCSVRGFSNLPDGPTMPSQLRSAAAVARAEADALDQIADQNDLVDAARHLPTPFLGPLPGPYVLLMFSTNGCPASSHADYSAGAVGGFSATATGRPSSSRTMAPGTASRPSPVRARAKKRAPVRVFPNFTPCGSMKMNCP